MRAKPRTMVGSSSTSSTNPRLPSASGASLPSPTPSSLDTVIPNIVCRYRQKSEDIEPMNHILPPWLPPSRMREQNGHDRGHLVAGPGSVRVYLVHTFPRTEPLHT